MSTNAEIGNTSAEKRKQTRNSHSSTMNSELHNPCTKEQALSFKCLSDNNYDHDACTPHFLNYQTCKEFWSKVSRERRRNKITPYLPLPEERNRIKEEYIKTQSI